MTTLLVSTGEAGATTCVWAGRIGEAHVADLVRFRHVLWFVDAEGLNNIPPALEQADVVVEANLVGTLGSEVTSQLLERLLERDVNHLPAIRVARDVVEHDALRYEEILRQVRTVFDGAHRARATREADGFLWQKHLLLNASEYSKARLPAAWAGVMRGVPAYVCGAGPSLDVSVEALARVAGSGVILAADSALRALDRRGIRADFAVTIDVHKVPERCLPHTLPPARVILTTVSPPSWLTAMAPGSCVFISGRQVAEDWLHARGITRTEVSATENCGSTALEIARFLGCSPIYLFGMDLSTSADAHGARRSKDADPAIYRDPRAELAELPKVPGNYTTEVHTHVLADWHVLDERLSSWPEGLVHNVNDRGARLRNTTLVHPGDLVVPAVPTPRKIWFEAIAPPAGADADTVRRVAAEWLAFSRRGCEALRAMRRSVESGRPEDALRAFRTLLADADFAQSVGAFSLKVMPELCSSAPPRAERLVNLVGELEELCTLLAGFAPSE